MTPKHFSRDRTTRMELRAERYLFRIKDGRQRVIEPVSMWMVWTHEISPVPPNEKPLQWRLLSNRAVTTREEAVDIIYRYTQRWKIEEMHRCWKTVCGIEKTRLRSLNNILKLAVIMASIAVRIERLKTVYRTQPDASAIILFSPVEVEILKRLCSKTDIELPDTITTRQAVEWVAELGGYIGPHNGPPGAETIGRGLLRLETAMETLKIFGWKLVDSDDEKKSDQ